MSNYVLIEMYDYKYTSKSLNKQLLRVGDPLLPQSSNPKPKILPNQPKSTCRIRKKLCLDYNITNGC